MKASPAINETSSSDAGKQSRSEDDESSEVWLAYTANEHVIQINMIFMCVTMIV